MKWFISILLCSCTDLTCLSKRHKNNHNSQLGLCFKAVTAVITFFCQFVPKNNNENKVYRLLLLRVEMSASYIMSADDALQESLKMTEKTSVMEENLAKAVQAKNAQPLQNLVRSQGSCFFDGIEAS